MFTITRFIEHSYKPSAYNMVVDEAILYGDYKYPTLRFYQWKTPTLSIGHNQTIDENLLKKLKQNKINLVKRISGGGAVLHHCELTYSIIDPTGYLFNLGLQNTYSKISQSLLEGLNLLGIKAEMQKYLTKKINYRHKNNFNCFNLTQSGEITFNKKKIIGSAQYAYKNKVLQHGSIILKISPFYEKIFSQQEVKKIIGIREIKNISLTKIKSAFLEGFKKVFKWDIKNKSFTVKEKHILLHTYPK